MSQFRDTFTKDSNKEPLLSYDDSAFIFFAGTILICILIPCTYSYVKTLINKFFKNDHYNLKKSKYNSLYRSCTCSLCKFKQEKRNKSTIWQKIVYTKILQFFTLLILWALLSIMIYKMLNTKTMQKFDPFEILEVNAGATVGEIKKAYRLKSLKFHPDKNPNDTSAAANFILITKAYKALTDEISKDNYEKYGNPDGPGMMKIGIGLPKILIDERYQILILTIFFLIFIVFIPTFFIIYYQKQKQYGPNGVKIETLQYLTYTINENSRAKAYPEMLAATNESRDLELRETDDIYIKKMMDELIEQKKRTFKVPIITKNYFLILAHMQRRHDLLSEDLKNDLDKILQFSLNITHSIIEISILKDWFLTAQAAITFRRCLIQALDFRNSSLLQIPHFNDNNIRHVLKGKFSAKELLDFVHQDHENRKGLVDMSEDQILDVKSFCNIVPDIKVSAEIVVEDETHIVKGDVASIYVHIERLNLHEKESAGYIHAPFFPEPKFEEWWIIATYKGDDHVLRHAHVKSCEKELEEKLQFLVDKVGNLCITIHVFSDSYFGCDKKLDLYFKSYSTTEIKREIFVHPEDIELDNEPTLFQQMLGDIKKKSESSDENEFDKENKKESSKDQKENKNLDHENYVPEDEIDESDDD